MKILDFKHLSEVVEYINENPEMDNELFWQDLDETNGILVSEQLTYCDRSTSKFKELTLSEDTILAAIRFKDGDIQDYVIRVTEYDKGTHSYIARHIDSKGLSEKARGYAEYLATNNPVSFSCYLFNEAKDEKLGNDAWVLETYL